MAKHLASLTPQDLDRINASLEGTDRFLEQNYPGDDGTRQPIHTVYVPADRFTPSFAADWGAQAAAAVEDRGGLERLGGLLGLEPELGTAVASRVARKLAEEPIEDLRLDFEDGYGDRGDDAEDEDTVAAATAVAAAVQAGTAPPFIGIRFKCFEAPTRARGLRTLDLFVSTLARAGELPAGLVLTLPKVTTVDQVKAMEDAVSRLEKIHSLPSGRLKFEVQVETPQLILGADGTSPVAQLPHAVPGRISALHYGTYDYSASLQVAAEYQSMEHPVADLAKEIMQLAVAGTGIRLSDGSTNVIPVGDNTENAWKLHGRLVRRSLERGYYQGWDLHAAQLPSRFTATYAFYREGLPAAALRLRNYVEQTGSGVMDEPATARALAGFILRGVQCGAVSAEEVLSQAGVGLSQLTTLAHPRLASPAVN
ncbi:aldolase [Arthrobacter sp. Sa2BUA2]|uniref:Aldolase n=1 Tax=Arthrobacter pullicola TaxID=2762224 RepID=A0ABR8YJH7_9MICC|nr:aldolase [Arthrobacter pullicola]MBD8044373.1 aldolase [Arthrobacter pullicola]